MCIRVSISRLSRGQALGRTGVQVSTLCLGLRRRFAGRMARSEVFNCWRCGEPINPYATWDLGHVRDHTGAGG